MNRERSPRRKKQAAAGDDLSPLARRVGRGEEVRLLVEEALGEERIKGINFWSPGGNVSVYSERRVRQQVLTDRAGETGISEADLRTDLRLAVAVCWVRTHCGEEVVDVLLSANCRLTEGQVARLRGLEPETIRERIGLVPNPAQ